VIIFQSIGIVTIVILMLLYFTQKRISLKSSRFFIFISTLIFILLFVDIFSIYLIKRNQDATTTLFFCKLYLVILTSVSSLGLFYIIGDIYRYKPNQKLALNIILFSILIITAILELTLDIDTIINKKKTLLHTEGPACMACYIVSISFIIMTILLSLIKHNNIPKGKLNSILIWMTIWILAAIFQLLKPEYLVVSYASCLGLMIIYIMFENPERIIDSETSVFTSKAFDEYLCDLFESKKFFSIVYINLNDNNESPILKKNSALIAFSNVLNTFCKGKFLIGYNKLIPFRTETGFAVVLHNSSVDYFFTLLNDNLVEYNDLYDGIFNIKYLIFTKMNILRSYNDLKLLIKNVISNNIITYIDDKYYIDSTTIKALDDLVRMESILKDAIKNDNILVYYQPIYSKKENRITCAEALVRIKDYDGNIIYPDKFIELAEKNGSIIKLGELVFEKVCMLLNKCDTKNLGIEYIEVNLSVVQCSDINLAERYIAIMEKYHVNPRNINLEITETASSNLKNIMLDNMNKLIAYGVKFSLDDFGMGNSNLNYIIEMPIEIVKFDRTIVNSYLNDEKAKFVIGQIIDVIKSLKYEIVLEGIETKDNLDTVLKLTIDFIQGYYFSKPVPESDFISYVETYNYKQLNN